MSGAIVSLLWPKNLSVLCGFVQRHPGTTVLAPKELAGHEMREAVAAAGGRVEDIEALLAQQAGSGWQRDAIARQEALARAMQDPGWQGACAADWLAVHDLTECIAAEAGEQLPALLAWVTALRLCASHYAIRLLIVNEDLMPRARVAIAWAKRQGIPTLHLSHSLLLGEPYTVHAHCYADAMAVFGERGLEGYRDYDVAVDRMRITGNPGWDSYAQRRQVRTAIRAEVIREHGLASQLPIVVFGTTWAANLTSLGDESLYGKSLSAFLAACRTLLEEGVALQPVVKDRQQNSSFGRQRVQELSAKMGLAPGVVGYFDDDASQWVLAADVVVSVDSNLSVEAMLAGVPAINLLNEFGLLIGPTFDAESGVVEVAAEGLAAALRALLIDAEFRQRRLAEMRAAAPRYNVGVDGQATARVVALMEELALPEVDGRYPWQRLLDVEQADASQYHAWAQSHLFELFKHPPRRLLDIGCGAGGTGHAAKQAYPECTVFGIEVNRAAAEAAAAKLDHVATGRFEDIDLEAFGIAPGSIDTVIVADVLEHMYDPWHVMLRLRPYLTPDAQVIASIPNIRNLVAMSELAKGNWRYEPWGLLDITHVRFFTPREVRRFFHETGYRVTQTRFNLDSRLADFFSRHRHQEVQDVEFDRLVLKNVSQEELGELCSLQVHLRAEPGAQTEEEFSAAAAPAGASDYTLWRAARALQARETDLWEQRLTAWPAHPRVMLAVTVADAGNEAISRTLASVTGQLYHNVGITLVGATSPPEGWSDSENLRWRGGEDLLATLNASLLEQDADWLAVLDAGDELAPHALLFMLEAAHANPAWKMIYSDEDTIAANGGHLRPNFKPDFNTDLLRSYPYVGGLLLVAKDTFAELGGLAAAMLGIEDHDLALRGLERVGAAGIGHVAEVLYSRAEGGGHARRPMTELIEAGRSALASHLGRLGIAARIEPGLLPLSLRPVYEHAATPLVSVIMAVREGLGEVQRNVETLLGKTRYANIELLVLDANSRDAELSEYIGALESLGDGRLKAFRLDQDASLAAYRNLIAEQARGDYLLFLDADATALKDDWLDALMAHAQRPDIGAVGPRLLNGDGSVRSGALIAGLADGAGGGIGPAFAGLRLDDPGYFGRAKVEQNVAAIASAALLTRRSDFVAAQGFDATLAGEAAAADYCLRLSGLGLRVLWTPHVSLLSSGAAEGIAWGGEGGGDLQANWLSQLGADPAYNRNLKLTAGAAFAIEPRTTLNWDPLPWRPLPRILAHPADNMGCGQYRMFAPLHGLVEAGHVQGWTDFAVYEPVELAHLELDTLVFQRQIFDEQIEFVRKHQRYSRALRVFELDDLLVQLPGRSAHQGNMPKDVADRLRRVVPLCDRFVVSTEPLAEAYRGINDDIRVVPNFLERWRWQDLPQQRRHGKRPRVGWVGGAGHSGDLEMLSDVVLELAGEVDWVFMGMCPDALRIHVREFHQGVPFAQYPKKMAALGLDLALAPLEVNAFNEAKSNLRVLEYGILGFPVICSDIYPYQGDFPVTRVRNRSTDWINAIREQVADRDECARRGEALRQHILEHWMLEDHLDLWLGAWLR